MLVNILLCPDSVTAVRLLVPQTKPLQQTLNGNKQLIARCQLFLSHCWHQSLLIAEGGRDAVASSPKGGVFIE